MTIRDTIRDNEAMRCPRCGRDTFSKKWQTCSACDSERPRRVAPKPSPREYPKPEPLRHYAVRDCVCQFCGTVFPGTSKAVYCGDTCRQAAHRTRNGITSKPHTLVHAAIKRGDLVRAEVCSNCHLPPAAGGGILAHHDDYDRPLVVRWLCGSCHMRLHNGTLVKGQRIYYGMQRQAAGRLQKLSTASSRDRPGPIRTKEEEGR